MPSPEQRCHRKFVRFFHDGFKDETYRAWERDYKANAHAAWKERLAPAELKTLARDGRWREIASRAVAIESRTNLLFSFEKMALRDAVRGEAGARDFGEGLIAMLEARDRRASFEAFRDAVEKLPQPKSRVFTWPVVTVFPFIAQPSRHIFLKPNVTRAAALAYGFDFHYKSRPSWDTYASLLDFAKTVRRDLEEMNDPPRDMIDVQSFIWVLGSDEYA